MGKFLPLLGFGLLPLWIAIIIVVIGGYMNKNTADYWNVAPWLIMVSIPASALTLLFNIIKCDVSSLFKNAPDDIPIGVKGWSWGAFLLNWIWAIGNRTWIGLLVLIPFHYLGLVMAVVLGVKGREWAWKNNDWESVEHFNQIQKKWSFWGVLLIAGAAVIALLTAIAIPAYQPKNLS